MPYRSSIFRKLALASAMALVTMPIQSSWGGILGTESGYSSNFGTGTDSSTDKATQADLKKLREQRNKINTKITALEKGITAAEKKLKDGDKSMTQAKINKMKQDLTDLKELKTSVNTLILDTKQELADKSDEDDDKPTEQPLAYDPNTGQYYNPSTGQYVDPTTGQPLTNPYTGQPLTTGSPTGTPTAQDPATALISGLLQSMMGTNPLNSMAANSMPTLNNNAVTANPTLNQPVTKPDDTKKDEESSLPECGPDEPKDTTSTGTKPGEDKMATSEAAKTSTGSTTDTNPGKAADDYVGPSSKSTTDANPGKAEDDKVKPAEKPKCRSPQVNTPNPISQGDLSTSKKITSMEDAQKYVGKYMCDPASSNCTANGQQCASLTKYFCDVGSASSWQGGTAVKGASIPVGTCVATFSNNGNYGPANSPGGASGMSHTGVYLGQNAEGVIMLHQWNGSGGARISTIPWSAWGKNVKEGGNQYKTISFLDVFRTIDWYLPPVTIAFHIPLGEGLAKL